MPSDAVRLLSSTIRFARLAGTELDRGFADLGLTSQQAAVLVNVFAGHTTAQALSKALSVDTGGMTRLIDRLVDGDWLERIPSVADRRVIEIGLTAKGAATAPTLPEHYERVAARLTRSLPPSRVRTLLESFDSLAGQAAT